MDKNYLENLNYLDVLTNCKYRSSADMNKVQQYVLKYNKEYKDIIIKRHQDYVTAYIKSGYSLQKLSKAVEIPATTLLSIFLRIESQFNLYEAYEVKMIKDSKIRRIREEKIKQQQMLATYSKFNPGLSEERNKKVIDVLKKTYDKKLDDVLSVTAINLLNKLYAGKTVKKAAKELCKSDKYLATLIIGTNKPRSNNEKGILRILEENNIKL